MMKLESTMSQGKYPELFPRWIRIAGTTTLVNPRLAHSIMLSRKNTKEAIFNFPQREAQAKLLYDEDIADKKNKIEMMFLKGYALNGENFGVLETANLIKCIGYIGTQGELKNTIQRDLINSIGLVNLNRVENMISRYSRK